MKSKTTSGFESHRTQATRENTPPLENECSVNYGSWKKGTIKPTRRHGIRNQFLTKLDWTNPTLEHKAEQAVEALLVEFHKIFAQHRFDTGIKTEFKMTLTPLSNRPARSQSLPAPITL